MCVCVCVLTILTWQDGSLFRIFVPGSCIPPSAAGVHYPDTTATKQAHAIANNISIKGCQTAEAETKRQMADRRRLARSCSGTQGTGLSCGFISTFPNTPSNSDHFHSTCSVHQLCHIWWLPVEELHNAGECSCF